MALVFAGAGIAELQEGGFRPHAGGRGPAGARDRPSPHGGDADAQGGLVAPAVVALLWTFVIEPAGDRRRARRSGRRWRDADPDLCDRYGDRVHVAEPLFRDFGGRAAFTGEIETVRVLEDNALVRRILEGEGRVACWSWTGRGSCRCALIGGRLAALASANGWAGLVVNGCVRDVGEIASVPLGVKALRPARARPPRLEWESGRCR